MPKQTVQGAEIAYELHGTSGDPVVLIHGSLVDRRTWDLVVPGLAEAMQVVTYDRRGYGESRGPPSLHRVREDARDLAGLLEAIDVFPAHIIAHSYGGAVALRLAIDHPQMVRSLAIHEAPLVGLLADDPATASEGRSLLDGVETIRGQVTAGEREPAASAVVNVFSSEPGAWERLPPEVRRSFAGTMPLWAEEFADPEAVRPDRVACRDLIVPALLTTGSLSPRFLARVALDLDGLLRNGQRLEIPDVGHAPHLTRPHQYIGLLVTFLLERNVPVS
ncbi:MAG TPA: alpha/beta hydrolase [Thermoplasmata archaeon]|nr:alpha/beta hydrolase [Thermoplasmata archaeon]